MGEYAANTFNFPDLWDITQAHMPGSVYPDTQLYRGTDVRTLCLEASGCVCGTQVQKEVILS